MIWGMICRGLAFLTLGIIVYACTHGPKDPDGILFLCILCGVCGGLGWIGNA